MFACLTRTDSGNDSESLCEPYLCSEALGFRQCPYVALKPTEDGWHTSSDSSPAPPNLPSTPQSCWQPCSNAGTSQGSWVFREHGKSGAIEEHLAGKWHIIALHEAVEYLHHECHFDITHFAGCAICSTKTLFTRTSRIIPSTSTKWATASRERRTIKVGPTSRHLPRLFRKDTAQRQSYFSMISLHINNQSAKKRRIGENLLIAARTGI